jgi:hypothetical protein
LKEFETAVDEVYDRLDDLRLVLSEVRPHSIFSGSSSVTGKDQCHFLMMALIGGYTAIILYFGDKTFELATHAGRITICFNKANVSG